MELSSQTLSRSPDAIGHLDTGWIAAGEDEAATCVSYGY